MALSVGSPTPDFSLFNTEKKELALSSLRGHNVVLLFFPLAFSSVCTAELCSVRDNMARYGSLKAQVIGISVDSPYTLARFKQDQQLNFELLSDFNKEVSAAYDALYPQFSMGMRGVSKRAAYVLDGEGTIRYAEVLENAGQQPDFAAIQKTLEQLSVPV